MDGGRGEAGGGGLERTRLPRRLINFCREIKVLESRSKGMEGMEKNWQRVLQTCM